MGFVHFLSKMEKLFFLIALFSGKSLQSHHYNRHGIVFGEEVDGRMATDLDDFDGDWTQTVGYHKNDIKFILYTRKYPKGHIIKWNDMKTIEKVFDKKKNTKFVTHGWLADGKSASCVKIKDGFLKKYDVNVFIVDWSKISKNVLYFMCAMATTSDLARHYGYFLTNLTNHGVDPKTIHLIGHSLGAHYSGTAARTVKKGKIGRITALDPAAPFYEKMLPIPFPKFLRRLKIKVIKSRLNKNDAAFVDVIHTSGGFLGMRDSIGHADFFVNGGDYGQPGCPSMWRALTSFNFGCCHARGWQLFAESLTNSVPFMAYRCASYKDFKNSRRGCKKKGVPMGNPTPSSARGNFYLQTNKKPPFAKGR